MTARKRTRVRHATQPTTIVVVNVGEGLGLDLGVETHDDTFSLTNTRNMGTETETDSFSQASSTIDTGSETESMVVSLTGSSTHPTGTETESQNFTAEQTRDTGSESESFMSDARADLSQHTTTTATITPDAPGWNNPTNAEGAINGTEANHPGLSGVDVSCDATLRCSGLVVTATPTGFTRTGVFIKIVSRWDLTITAPVAGVVDVVHLIILLDSADVSIATLDTKSAVAGSGSTAVLVTEFFDITALVTDAQLAAGVKVDCRVVADYVPAVNGNSSWDVDAVHLLAIYTRTGIT